MFYLRFFLAFGLMLLIWSIGFSMISHSNPKTKSKSLQYLEQLRMKSNLNYNNYNYDKNKNNNIKNTDNNNNNNNNKQSLYFGERWRTNQTIQAREIASSPYAVCEEHVVKSEDGNIYGNWLWLDELNQINVMAHLAKGIRVNPKWNKMTSSDEDEKKRRKRIELKQKNRLDNGEISDFTHHFLMMKTRKYGYNGVSLSPIGGLIEVGEKPLDAAKRELLEEAHLVSDNWIFLGQYRASVNRGGGFLFTYLAINSREATPEELKGIHSDDQEKQEFYVLDETQVLQTLLSHEYKEVKWATTASLSLLWLDNNIN